MQKYEVLKLLERLQGCETLKFVMGDIEKIVHTKNLKNYPDIELLESNYDNFKCPYCSIDEIHPIS